MKAWVIRTKMIGGGNSYDVEIPTSQFNERKEAVVRTIIDGREHISLTDATMAPDHWSMPVGFERYDQYLAHQAKCKVRELTIVQAVFPETRVLNKMPTLWIGETNLPSEHLCVEIDEIA